jgi:hypothetical protein
MVLEPSPMTATLFLFRTDTISTAFSADADESLPLEGHGIRIDFPSPPMRAANLDHQEGDVW